LCFRNWKCSTVDFIFGACLNHVLPSMEIDNVDVPVVQRGFQDNTSILIKY